MQNDVVVQSMMCTEDGQQSSSIINAREKKEGRKEERKAQNSK